MDELEILALGADAIDAQTAAGEPGAMQAAQEGAAQQDEAQNNVSQIALMLAIAVPLLGKMYPSIATIYTEQAQAQVSAALGPVLTKYGVSLSDIASSYGPEIAAALVCVPLAMATIDGVKGDILASRKQAPKGDALRAAVAVAVEPEAVVLG